MGCINKASLITTSEIRFELSILQRKVNSYQTSVSNYYFNNQSKDLSGDLEESVFDFAKLLKNDLGIENDIKVDEKIIKLRCERALHCVPNFIIAHPKRCAFWAPIFVSNR